MPFLTLINKCFRGANRYDRVLKCAGNVKPVNSPDVDDDSAVGENINEASLEHPTLLTLLQYHTSGNTRVNTC